MATPAAAPTKSNVGVRDVPAPQFVKTYAAFLKKSGKVTLPKWVDIVKTGKQRELAPLDPDWYYTRMASIARNIYRNPGTGVGALRVAYGKKERRGTRPGACSLASGAVILTAVKQLENMKIVEKMPSGGRRLTAAGRRDLDRMAGIAIHGRPVKAAPAKTAKPAAAKKA
eukprot:TRINITY_DN119_c0_g1_i1.p1 TRINITY_DN119_c0_g1~~TRINITY_DN119_c0_g1_i1.p1  ORF type:complete len:192 (-),score=32.60 TRINITY_DN119_c0_g1_i1:42-551(-)